jgi:hypothetical protein
MLIHAPCTYINCAPLLCHANNSCTLLFCRAPISTTQFWFLHYSLLHAIFVSCTDIPHTFHSMHCTMPEFSMLQPHTNTLHTPLTKLSCNNIYPYCACTNQTPLCFANTAHHALHYYVCAHRAHLITCMNTAR